MKHFPAYDYDKVRFGISWLNMMMLVAATIPEPEPEPDNDKKKGKPEVDKDGHEVIYMDDMDPAEAMALMGIGKKK